jgi:uncharacterized protein YajQ (UPF0234 family)
MPSFDVSTGVDLQEVDNALNQARKELQNRYDFKGMKWEADFDRKENKIKLHADDGTKLRALWDVIAEKMVKRGVPLKNLDASKPVEASMGTARQEVALTMGITTEKAKEIVRHVKDAGVKKVQASIQGDVVRITGPKKDELQACMAMLKAADFGIALKFGNFRD